MRKHLGWFVAAGLLVAVLLAGVVSNFASGSPDGLDATAREGCTLNADDEITGGTCMAQQEQDHQLAGSPLADYGIKGIDNPYVSTGLAGITGVLITFGLGAAAFWLARRRGATTTTPPSVRPSGTTSVRPSGTTSVRSSDTTSARPSGTEV